MEYIRTLSREFPTGDRADLAVDARSGTVAVRGEDIALVRIEVVAHLWAEDDLEADEQQELIAHGLKQEDGRVIVRAPTLLRPHPLLFFGRGPRVDYQITVPRATRAEIASQSGRIDVESIRGPLKVDSRSGRVGARDIGGSVEITSRSGTVQAESIAGDTDVESRRGGVRVAGSAGAVAVRSRSGSVVIEEPGAGVKVEARSGSVRYDGDVRGPITIEVESGSVRVTVNPGAVFFLDAEAASGSARSDLRMREGGGAVRAGDAPTVRLRTRSGSIYIGPR